MSETEPGAALVTGAARRIGRAIAEGLARRGHAVALHYRASAEDAGRAVDAIESAGGRAVALAADLADEPETGTLIARAEAALGPVTVLVNNASVFERDSVATASRESWDRHMETNLRAPFVLMQSMAAALPADRTGNIVNILDERVWNLTPHFVSYTLTKAGLWTLTRTMALALAPRIRVNGVGPGPTLPSPRQSPEQFERQAGMMPLGRGTSPAEVAGAVEFILRAPAMTGQMLALDGGQHLGWAQPPRGTEPVFE
ncbi:MAG: SDR family oxidoreductase [Defluviicoccus sp.]|nr:SDR family oxidoreductase [Defluviicoccus sp.]MDE0386081.1 SDR family oxidoreductase [Defluviicoccus sp.]